MCLIRQIARTFSLLENYGQGRNVCSIKAAICNKPFTFTVVHHYQQVAFDYFCFQMHLARTFAYLLIQANNRYAEKNGKTKICNR